MCECPCVPEFVFYRFSGISRCHAVCLVPRLAPGASLQVEASVCVCARSRARRWSTLHVSTMVARRETAFEKSVRKRIESQRELTKGQVQEINQAMKANLQVVPPLDEALQRAMREGGIQQSGSGGDCGNGTAHMPTAMLALPAPPSSSTGAPCNASASAGSASSAGDIPASGVDAEAGSSADSPPPPSRSFRGLGSPSVAFLQELLHAIEPVVFSKHCVSVVTRRGARLQNIKALCESSSCAPAWHAPSRSSSAMTTPSHPS